MNTDQVQLQWGLLNAQNALPPTGRTTIYVFVTPDTGPQMSGAAGKNWGYSGSFLIWDGDTSSVDNFSHVFSHELAESMSSPDGDGYMVNPGAGWPNQPTSILGFGISGWGQIGDFEPDQHYLFHMTSGVQVQAYWSLNDQAFIVPDGSALHQFYVTPMDNPAYVPIPLGGQIMTGFSVSGYNLDILAYQGAPTNDQIEISMVPNPINGLPTDPANGSQEIQITVNGETAWFDDRTIKNLNIYAGGGQTTLTLNGLDALKPGGSFNVDSAGDLKVIYTENSSLKVPLTVGLVGKLTVVGAAYPNPESVAVTNNSITVNGNAPLQYSTARVVDFNGTVLQALTSLEVDGGVNCTFTIQSTPSGTPLSIVTAGANNNVALLGLSEPVTISTLYQDVFTAAVQPGGQWTLTNLADPLGVDVTINGNTVEYQNYVALTLPGIQGLMMNGSPGNTHFTVESTGTAEPLTINTGAGTNTVDVAAAASAVIIDANGTDTVNIGSAQTLDGVDPVTVHGDGNTTLTLNDQNTPLPASYGIIANEVERDGHRTPSSTTTTLFNYDHIKTLTLSASNNDSNGGGNVIDIEVTTVPTYVNGGTATTSISVDSTLKNLDNIGAYLTIAGASSPVSVYDQADAHASSGTPIAYAVSDEGVTRTVTSNGSQVATRIDTLPVQSVTLYTSQTMGSLPNTVAAGSYSAPATLVSGAADAVTVIALGGPLAVDAHGGTVTFDDHDLQNLFSPYTTDPQHTHGYTVTDYTLGYTITDHTVARSEHAHWVEVVDPLSGSSTGGQAVSAKDYYFNGTFSYQNARSLTIAGSPVDSTFAVQSTPTGMPVTITGSTGSRVSVPGTPGGSTVNRLVVGLNGSVKSIHSQLTFDGSSASDTVLVDDSQATLQDIVTVANGTANDVQLGLAATDQFFGSGGGLDCLGIGSATLNLSKAAGDKVSLSPSAVTAFFVNANDPGADLELNTGGLTFQETQTSPGTGKFTFGSSAKAVSFQNFGTIHTR
jgi:hypothetical protein